MDRAEVPGWQYIVNYIKYGVCHKGFLPAARNEHAGLHFTWALLEEKEEEVWRGTFCE